MKYKSIKQLSLAFCLLLSTNAFGQTYVNVGDLKYQLDGTAAYVAGFATNSNGVANVVIPETIESDGLTFNVTKINSSAFSSKSIIVSVSSTSHMLRSIESSAFSNCTNLKEVDFSTYYSIDVYAQAFKNCTSLETVTLNASTIGYEAFMGCSNLEKVEFRVVEFRIGLSRMDYRAFKDCVKLPYIVIPSNCIYHRSVDNHYYYTPNSNYTNQVGFSKDYNGNDYNDAFAGCNRLQAIIYLGNQNSQCGSNATVYNAKNWGSWSGDTFDYNGIAPTPTYSYNGQVAGFEVTACGLSTLEVNAGTYTATVPVTFENDDMSFTVDKEYTYTINKLPVTAEVKNVSRVYGDENPEFEVEYTGLIDGEDESVITSKKITCAATQTSPVGTYDITLSNVKADNYEITEITNGTLTVTKAPLVIYAGEYSREVGQENPTFTARYSGWKNNETVAVLNPKPTLTCSATANSPVGQYEITPTGAGATNYSISYRNGVLNVTTALDTDNALSIADAVGYTGHKVTFPIVMDNVAEVTGMQMDLCLPEGVTVAQNLSGKNMIALTARMEEQYSVSSNVVDEGIVRITGLSIENEPFTGNSGAILNVTLMIDENMAVDNYEIGLKNIILSDVTGTMHRPADVTATLSVNTYSLGDVDDSGDVNINDAVLIVNHILNKTMTVFVEPAADVDGSGDININDPVVLINRFILHKTNARAMAPVQRAATADENYLQIATVNMKPGETKTIAVEMKNSEGIIGTQCNIILPEGLSFAYTLNKKGNKVYTIVLDEDRKDDHTISSNLQEDGSMIIATISGNGETFYENEGTLFTFDVVADAGITPGGYEIQLSDVVLSCGTAIEPADRTSILNVLPDLDEDVTQFAITSDIPEADVTLKRTIVADKYNTLSIPFDLTDAQVKTAFGSDATVYTFSNVTDGEVAFTSTVAGISANVPVLLKTSTGGSSYDFTGVTLKPGSPVATGSFLDFVGNYDGDIVLDEGVNFLNDNKLYRAKDKSHLKGYRAFIQDKSGGNARSVTMTIDGTATVIDNLEADESDETVYKLDGQIANGKGNGLKKGFYVIKGKMKVVR